MAKMRLDLLMVERSLAESRSLAQRLVMEGRVRVDGEQKLKPSVLVQAAAHIVVDQGPPFVSRGGEKLQAALQAFPIDINERVCADLGASTGGFTDCLLQHGACRVYAVDVGKGILHWKLRQDPRVVVMEETNARYVERLPEPVTLVTVDASFISLKILLPVVRGWFAGLGKDQIETGQVIALIKPQFEAGRAQVKRGEGVIRDPQIHRQVLQEVLDSAAGMGYRLSGLIRSPLLGPKGNTEFLAWLELGYSESAPQAGPDRESLFTALFPPSEPSLG